VFQGSPVVRSRSSFEERTNSVTPDFLVTQEPNFPVSASFMNGRLSPAAHVAPGPPCSLTRRTCRYLRDLAKRRLGHSHVLNNPASSDGYLQALLVYDRASHSNRGQGPPDGRTVLLGRRLWSRVASGWPRRLARYRRCRAAAGHRGTGGLAQADRAGPAGIRATLAACGGGGREARRLVVPDLLFRSLERNAMFPRRKSSKATHHQPL